MRLRSLKNIGLGKTTRASTRFAAMVENAGRMAGMPVGPLALNDEVAIDLGWRILLATEADLGPDAIEPRQTRRIELQNDAVDMLLFDFLQELIYFKDAERLLLRAREIDIKKKGDVYSLKAAATGEPLDPARHQQRADVKALTLHDFHVERDESGWKTTATTPATFTLSGIYTVSADCTMVQTPTTGMAPTFFGVIAADSNKIYQIRTDAGTESIVFERVESVGQNENGQ